MNTYCNGCRNEDLKRRLGKKYLSLEVNGCTCVYQLDAIPRQGQESPIWHEDRQIRFMVSFLDVEHCCEVAK